jgi:hypothetical protein
MSDGHFQIVGPDGVVERDLLWEDAFALKIERRYDDDYRIEPMPADGGAESAEASGEAAPPVMIGAPVADAYRVRSGKSRVIGPLPRAIVVDLIVAGRVQESDTVAPDQTSDWVPLTEIPQFNAALHERAALGLRPGWVQPKWTRPLDARGLAPFFLELAKDMASGWLRVEGSDGARAGVVTIAGGHIVHARADSRRTTRIGTLLVEDGLCTQADVQRAVEMGKDVGVPVGVVLIDLGIVKPTDIEITLVKQADLRLRELFLMTAGTARFEENEAALGEDPVFDTPPVQLVRDLFQRAGPSFIDVALRDLTRSDVEVVARDARFWSVEEADLTDTEMMLLSDLGRPGPIGPALISAQEDADEMTVAIGALLLSSARCLNARRKGVTPELTALEALLNADDPFGALDVGKGASKLQIQLSVERLRGQIRLVAEDAPDAQKRMLDRCNVIERLLTNPKEAHVFAAADRMGLDPNDASVRRSLEIDYHRVHVDDALRAGNGEDARQHALAWRKLDAKNPLALAAQARVYLRFGDNEERVRGLAALRSLPKTFPDEPLLHVALAEAALDLGDKNLARQQIGRALAAGASPASIAALDARLEGS